MSCEWFITISNYYVQGLVACKHCSSQTVGLGLAPKLTSDNMTIGQSNKWVTQTSYSKFMSILSVTELTNCADVIIWTKKYSVNEIPGAPVFDSCSCPSTMINSPHTHQALNISVKFLKWFKSEEFRAEKPNLCWRKITKVQRENTLSLPLESTAKTLSMKCLHSHTFCICMSLIIHSSLFTGFLTAIKIRNDKETNELLIQNLLRIFNSIQNISSTSWFNHLLIDDSSYTMLMN